MASLLPLMSALLMASIQPRHHQGYLPYYRPVRGLQTVSEEGQVINVLGFAGHIISTQLSHCST